MIRGLIRKGLIARDCKGWSYDKVVRSGSVGEWVMSGKVIRDFIGNAGGMG